MSVTCAWRSGLCEARHWFLLRKLKKFKPEWGGTRGLERTRWVIWELRLNSRDGVVLRGLRPPLIRALAIFSAISWLVNEVEFEGKTFLKVLKTVWDDAIVCRRMEAEEALVCLSVSEFRRWFWRVYTSETETRSQPYKSSRDYFAQWSLSTYTKRVHLTWKSYIIRSQWSKFMLSFFFN